MDCSLPGSYVFGILLARTLEWVVMPSSGDLPDPGIKPMSLISPAPAGGFFTTSAFFIIIYLFIFGHTAWSMGP